MNSNQTSTTYKVYSFFSPVTFVKYSFLIYNSLLFLAFLEFLINNKGDLLIGIITYIYHSGWGYVIFMSPALFIVFSIDYFLKYTHIEKLPKETTIYEAITRPTLMYGSIKVISPKLEDKDNN